MNDILPVDLFESDADLAEDIDGFDFCEFPSLGFDIVLEVLLAVF